MLRTNDFAENLLQRRFFKSNDYAIAGLVVVLFFFLIVPTAFANAAENFPKAGFKSVHTLDVYQDNNVIHALYSGVDKQSNQVLVKYLNSSDSGKTWSVPVAVNQGVATAKQTRRGNDIQLAAHGNKVMAVWQTKGGEPWTGKIVAVLSQDMGKTWRKITSPVSEQYAKVDQGYFDLAADKNGDFHIVWLDDREEAGDTQGLRYARFISKKTGGEWLNHKDLEAGVCTCCWSKIMTDERGNINVLFRDDKPRDMMLMTSSDGGKSWQKPGSVSPFGWEFTGCPHQGGGIAQMRQGDKVKLNAVVWNGIDSHRGLYFSQTESGVIKWSPVVSVGDKTSRSGDIAVSENKHIAIVYTAGDTEAKKIMIKISEDGGQSWSKEQRLNASGSDGSHPRVIGTKDGFRVFWTEWLDNGDAKGMMSAL